MEYPINWFSGSNQCTKGSWSQWWEQWTIKTMAQGLYFTWGGCTPTGARQERVLIKLYQYSHWNKRRRKDLFLTVWQECESSIPLLTSIYAYSKASCVALEVKNPPANSGDIRDVGSIPGLGRSLGGGHVNPLQNSCLENPKDRGDWQATVHRVTKSRTQLKQLSTQAHMKFQFIQNIYKFRIN